MISTSFGISDLQWIENDAIVCSSTLYVCDRCWCWRCHHHRRPFSFSLLLSIAQTYNNIPLNIKLVYQSYAFSSFTTGQWILFHFFASSWDSINNPKLLLYFKLYFDGPVAQWCMHIFVSLSLSRSLARCLCVCLRSKVCHDTNVNRKKWLSV